MVLVVYNGMKNKTVFASIEIYDFKIAHVVASMC